MNLQEREKCIHDNLHDLRKVLDTVGKLCPLDHNLSTSLSNGALILEELQTQIHELFLLFKLVPKPSTPAMVDPHQLSDWTLKGEGNFGKVYECRLQGARVAVKILKDRASSSFLECHLLRELHHDNIVAFRGMGLVYDHYIAHCVTSPPDMDTDSGKTVYSGKTVPGNILSQPYIDSGVFMASPTVVSTSEVIASPTVVSTSEVIASPTVVSTSEQPTSFDSDIDIDGVINKGDFSEDRDPSCNSTDFLDSEARGYIDEALVQKMDILPPDVTTAQTTRNPLSGVQNKSIAYLPHQVVEKPTKQLQTGKFGTLPVSHALEPELKAGYALPSRMSKTQSNVTRSVLQPKQKSLTHKVLTNQGMAMFIVMEYIDLNLLRYLHMLTSPISYARAWDISRQISHAIAYLHSNDIAHRDLKPDNILIEVGPARLRIKVADFGLAWGCGIENLALPSLCKYGLLERPRRGYVHVRWGAPEFVFRSETGKSFGLQDYKRADIYSFGLVTCFAVTGVKAMAKLSTGQLVSFVQKGRRLEKYKTGFVEGQVTDENQMPNWNDQKMDYSFSNLKKNPRSTEQLIGEFVSLPKDLSGPLLDVIEWCLKNCPSQRPTAEELHSSYLTSKKNPYDRDHTTAELFSYGFLTNTQIFVADSLCSEPNGFYNKGVRSSGYNHGQLLCEIETGGAQQFDIPDWWSVEKVDLFMRTTDKYKMLAARKEIHNNVLAALKKLTFSRSGINEDQGIVLSFRESLYCHHRTMREIWMSLSDREKDKAVPCKSIVSPLFSNSFGLHVAVLTNEGPDNSQKFVFAQRSKRSGMPSQGVFTCGVVESVSSMDMCRRNGQYYIDLVNTAARGLKEEIGLELTGSDLDAICLTTVYLKYDFHEWGMCGFVDLKDERITEQHRLSADNIKARFTSGPKDKFEHQTLTFVDFRLDSMVKFVSQNHENFASSAKLVVIKVLEIFYGIEQVDRAFHYTHE